MMIIAILILMMMAAPVSASDDRSKSDVANIHRPASIGPGALTGALVMTEGDGFVEPYGITATDEDANGLYDYLVTTYTIQVASSFSGKLDFELYDVNNNMVSGLWGGIDLYAGLNTERMYTSGSEFVNNDFVSPYSAHVVLRDMEDNILAEQWIVSGAYQPEEFDYISVVGEVAEYTEPAEAPYTALGFEADVEVSAPGTYYSYCWIIESGWVGQQYAATSYELTTGLNHISIEYPSNQIFNLGADGPWMVQWFIEDRYRLPADWRFFDTGPYLVSDFVYVPALPSQFIDPMNVYPVDSDSDGLYESLDIDIGMEIGRFDYYLVNMNLVVEDPVLGTLAIGYYTIYDYFDVGTYTLHMSLDSYGLATCGIDGPYRVVIELINVGTWETYDTVWLETEAMTPKDFQAPELKMQWIKSKIGGSDHRQILGLTMYGSDVLDVNELNPTYFYIGDFLGTWYQCLSMHIADVDLDGVDDLMLTFDAAALRSMVTSKDTKLYLCYGDYPYSSSVMTLGKLKL